MKTAFAYIRVSTQKQGFDGASLPEQRSSIERYAVRNGITILRWFQEEETAAKRGRKHFSEMMRLAKRGAVQGLIFHKIDRSTRNLAEWAEVSSLPEQGIEVHYSHEPVDLNSSHGRTAADVAAVFAASYIRNLREETKKGLYGRLKQGLYPWAAPIGYLNNGRAQLKTIDPVLGPLVRDLFERYATGEWSYSRLLQDAQFKGHLGRHGKPLTKNNMTMILRNPFYAGLMKVKTSPDTYEGKHEPLISMRLFEKVQDVLDGKLVPKSTRHEYLFQKLLRCTGCERVLIGERQKGHIYYRCHQCSGTCLQETALEDQLGNAMKDLSLTEAERAAVSVELRARCQSLTLNTHEARKALTLRQNAIATRIDRLTDTYIDGGLTRAEYDGRKLGLLKERRLIEEELFALEHSGKEITKNAEKKLELVISFKSRYFSGNREEKRELLKIATSNLLVSQKTLVAKWEEPFETLMRRGGVPECCQSCATSRTGHNQASAIECTSDGRSMRLVEAIIKTVQHDIVGGFSPFPPSAPSIGAWQEHFRAETN